MEREKIVVIDVFLCDLHIIVTEDANESLNKRGLRAYKEGDTGVDMKECNGFVTKKMFSDYYVFLPPTAAFSVIAHESVHVVGRIFGDRGVVADYDNDEIFAYYVGWIAGIIADEASEAYKSFTHKDDPSPTLLTTKL